MPCISVNDVTNEPQPKQTVCIIVPSAVFFPAMDPVRHSNHKSPQESEQPTPNIPQDYSPQYNPQQPHGAKLGKTWQSFRVGNHWKGEEKGGTIGGIEMRDGKEGKKVTRWYQYSRARVIIPRCKLMFILYR
jgi:hypothetical protein